MEQLQDDFSQTRVMGQWLLRMADRVRASAAVQSLPPPLRAGLDVRRTIWGAEARTDSDAAAAWLKDHYRSPASLVLAA